MKPELLEKLLLKDEEIGDIEWTETPTKDYAADFSFVDNYREEVRVLLKAQLSAIEQKGYSIVKVDEKLEHKIFQIVDNANFKDGHTSGKATEQIIALIKGEK